MSACKKRISRNITMSAAFYVTLCLLFCYLQTNAVGADLKPPENLTMITMNTNYTLRWDWDQSDVNFTTQYVAKFKLKAKKKVPIWTTACQKMSRRSCDLTKFNLYFLGIYVLRVQANVNGQVSDWVEKEFCPDEDAALGPPTKVSLSPAGSDLEIVISDPLTSTNSSMKEHHQDLYYHILYWERSADTQASRIQTLNSKANIVTLPDLKAWTWYCVSVQSCYDFYNKKSSFTSSLCMQTEVVSGGLSTPTQVRLTSHDMNLMLTWDPPDHPASGLVYTTQFKSSVSEYRVGCVNISTCECDLSRLNNSIFEYGKYTGRVRAQSGTESSAWVESNQITMDKDTIISSPNVALFSNGATIEVSIKDPVFTISALTKVYNSVTYNITYWQDGQREKARSKGNIQQNRVVLNDLDPWTKYCVQVQIITERNPNLSKPSAAVCESTTSEEKAPWVAAIGTFCIVAIAVALVVVAVVYRKHMSHFLCPKDALPPHLKEYLLAPRDPSMYLDVRNSQPPDEIYHQVSIIADDRATTGGSRENLQQTA